MKNITKKYLIEEIKKLRESNDLMNIAASSNPFGVSIDLEEMAKEYLEEAEQRVRAEIWQKHYIKVLEILLKELED